LRLMARWNIHYLGNDNSFRDYPLMRLVRHEE
jgi:hypothetical protein